VQIHKLALAILVLSSISLVLTPNAFAAEPTKKTHQELVWEAEFKNIYDECPDPISKEYIQNWSCGNWEVVGDEVRRVFRMTVNEHAQIDVGAPTGEKFQAWAFNGTIPGPTLRMTEGDKVVVYIINSDNSTRPHSFHKHSSHASVFDGAGHDRSKHFIMPKQTGQYLFDAMPYGVYPYHCHVDPVADHINRGLYGVLIIDPPTPRPPANEMIMLMNGYDFDYDAEGGVTIEMPSERVEGEEEEERDNEIYTVNGKAFLYMHDDVININLGEKQRIYLVNMLEFDLVNNFHLHGNVFNYSASGTYLSDQNQITTDIITQSQGDRGIIEFLPEHVGTFMIHAHINEFTSLGWEGFLQVNKR
jgi:FtsP/CotA-like multicopper oxidase with cupredoxin domain